MENEIKIDHDDLKRAMSYLQWRFETKFDKPPKNSAPKREHLYAFYNFYDEVLSNTDNDLEKLICVNQKKNIVNLANYIHKLKENEFKVEYNKWLDNKLYPEWN